MIRTFKTYLIGVKLSDNFSDQASLVSGAGAKLKFIASPQFRPKLERFAFLIFTKIGEIGIFDPPNFMRGNFSC